METDPNKINDHERQVEARIIEIGEAYADSNKRQKVENKKRAENRSKIKDLGVGTYAYQVAVKVCKDMTESERKDFVRDLEMLVRVLGPKQQDFFADELIKAEKRAQREADKKAKTVPGADELNAKSDANPKSDPKRGGAGKKKVKPDLSPDPPTMQDAAAQSDAALAESIAAVSAAEQAEGDAILKDAGKPKSQSTIAQEKLAEAKLA